MLWTRRAHQCTVFQTFKSSNENSLNSSCHFWNHKVMVYSNFASLFSVMKDNSTVFFSSNLIYLGQKEPIEVKCSEFRMVWWKFTKFHMSYLRLQVSFSLNFASLFSVTRDNFFIFIGTLKSLKICTLIGPFCAKYKTFHLKMYKEAIFYDTEVSCKIWRRTEL